MFEAKTKIIAGIAVLAVTAAAAYFLFKPDTNVAPTGGQPMKDGGSLATSTVDDASAAAGATSTPYIVPGQKATPTPQDIQKEPTLYVDIMADDDKDGLTNVFEARYATNPKSPDTDDDGLTDYQEVMSYFTDPVKQDSDGDAHKDGEEAKNGFNPCGEGQLLTGPALAKQCQEFKKK